MDQTFWGSGKSYCTHSRVPLRRGHTNRGISLSSEDFGTLWSFSENSPGKRTEAEALLEVAMVGICTPIV